MQISTESKHNGMSKIQILLRALKISLKIKGIFSMIISIAGFPAAVLPVLLANRLRALTDELQNISDGASYALTIFAVVVGLYIAQVIINFLQSYASGVDEIKIRRYIQRTVMRHKCEVHYKYIENFDDFKKRIEFANQYAAGNMARSMGKLISLLQLLVAFAAASFALWEISPVVVLVLYITSVPAAVLAYLQQDETFRGRAKWMEEGALAIHYYHMIAGPYSLDNVQEIRHFALFDYLKARWRALADEYVSIKNKVTFKHVKFNTAADFLRSGVYMGILLLTAYQIYQNPAIGLGAFTLVFVLSGQLQNVTGELFTGVMVLAQNIPYMQEFFYLDSLPRVSVDKNANVKTGEVANSDENGLGRAKNARLQARSLVTAQTDLSRNCCISFENVNFAYPNTDVDVLKDVSISIRDGEKIAVVGENGSGKSTFISLLCGMFEPRSGEIKTPGAVSVVFQDFAQYEANLRENITVSDKHRNASDDEIMELLRKINVNDVVEEQPNGLDELVGSFSEKANNLSGGQWQKISIARAAYRQDAKIMILDEPTSALDPVAEAQLYRNFADLTGDKTTILISHRLGITAIVDRILVFKDGRIVEDGCHKQLMSQDGHYAEMYRAQAQWYQ